MIEQLKNGEWIVSGAGPVMSRSDLGESSVVVPNAVMQAFIHEQVKLHTEHALKILIEHQRHALLPEQSEGHDR